MKFTGSNWKRSRRLGISLLEDGRELKKRAYGPGQHGNSRKKKQSEYGLQLTEKQKLRQMYGVNERQFRRMFMIALKSDEVTGFAFTKLLESRLDNLVYRMGFARTRAAARQLVCHGHILVNGNKLDIPSALISLNDVISVKEASQNMKVIKESLEAATAKVGWVEVDAEKLSGKFIRFPEETEINQNIKTSLIVEYYNRKL